MRELHRTIEIEAPASVVWDILTDFESYREWNPFIPDIRGELREGAKLRVTMSPPGETATMFKPELQVIAEEQELRWKGKLLFSGLFDGEHVFRLEPQPGGSLLFIQEETFTGALAAPLLWIVGEKTGRGFAEMNEALKKRAEERVRSTEEPGEETS